MSDSEDANSVSTSTKKPFICGVCEGFYGKPWTTEQRQELFLRMNRMGMSTYLYAPKDDHKHRLYWRDLYGEEEAEDLRELIVMAKENNVTFVYALSPGLDITYSDEDDVQCLKAKLDQIAGFGCEAFSLLFDDIDPDMVEEDEETFDSVAHAQCSVTNEAFIHLKKPAVFLFCPTEYCTSRATPDLIKSNYLKTLGEMLEEEIDILWTGPRVVSRRITLSGIKDVIKLIKRHPVIWDNIHANDYDQTRVYLGPYEGRCEELRMLLSGVLTNPNCEFEANFVAMHTLAQWNRNRCESYQVRRPSTDSATQMETDKMSPSKYNPKSALEYAVADWLPEFYKPKYSERKPRSESAHKYTKMDVDGAEDIKARKSKKDFLYKPKKKGSEVSLSQYTKSNNSRTKDKRKMKELEKLTINELLLICDLFYLPYEYGPRGVHLLKTAHWLISNVDTLAGVPPKPNVDAQPPAVKAWYEKAIHFHECHKDFGLVVDKFVNITNRELLYDLYNYIGDMRNCLSLVNSYIKWHGMGQPDKEPFRRGEQEPWVHRSGIFAEFRRLLPLEGQNDMFPKPGKLTSGNRVFTIRPYLPEDKKDVYAVCLKSCDDGLDGTDVFPDHPDLVPDDWIGCLLENFQQHAFVLQDDAGICGYVAAAPHIDDYHRVLREDWLPKMREKYPKPDILHNDVDITPAEEVIATLHKDLRTIPQRLKDMYPAYMQIQILNTHVEGHNTPTQLFNACQKGLKAAGVPGIHTVLHSNQLCTLSFRFHLGFEKISTEDEVDMGQFLLLGLSL